MSTEILIAAVIVLVLVLVIVYVLVPYRRLRKARANSREHLPQANEIWIQDDQLLYIEHSDVTGVECLAFDPDTKTPYRWKDTWTAWNERLDKRVVYFTGQRQSLTK
jgi:hypothetical protein